MVPMGTRNYPPEDSEYDYEAVIFHAYQVGWVRVSGDEAKHAFTGSKLWYIRAAIRIFMQKHPEVQEVAFCVESRADQDRYGMVWHTLKGEQIDKFVNRGVIPRQIGEDAVGG